jgi:glycerophosphoryl diester phosphodiesterase
MSEIIAHRGAPHERRENTLASFARALELGAAGIELDVHGTRDGDVVVHHDPVVHARTGEDRAPRTIASSTRRELDELLPPDERVPTLTEVLDLVGRRATIYVEIKAPRIEERVVHVLRDAPETSRCAVHGFDHRIVRRIHALAPDLECGILLTSYLVDPLRALADAGARDLWQQVELLDAELVALVHGAGGRVIAWTVNDLALGQRLADWGVDGLCTDRCGAFARGIR